MLFFVEERVGWLRQHIWAFFHALFVKSVKPGRSILPCILILIEYD